MWFICLGYLSWKCNYYYFPSFKIKNVAPQCRLWGQSQWSVSMHCFQNKFADKVSIKRIMKQPPQCMSFILTLPRLGKAFNYCKMIGSHARWWNNLALSGDFILFHRVGNNARGVSPWWNYFLLSPLCFMQKVQFCWYDALINVHDILVKTPTETGLICPS